MIIKGKIEDILGGWFTESMTDPWPEHIAIRTPEQLTYTALVRCACGAGMAYATHLDSKWGCSAILTGKSQPSPKHSELYPFVMRKFKPENEQATTRAEATT